MVEVERRWHVIEIDINWYNIVTYKMLYKLTEGYANEWKVRELIEGNEIRGCNDIEVDTVGEKSNILLEG